MFKALSRLFGSKKPKAPRLSLPVPGAAASLVKSGPVPAPAAPAPAAAPPSEPTAKAKWKEQSGQGLSREATPEELCGITPGMTQEEIGERLAKLYQRHNRAASSLEPQLREEAEFMLETLAGLREKYFGPPTTA
jgi:hypothetical protein